MATEEALMDLSEALVGCGDVVLGKMDLSEALTAAIRGAQRIRSGSARNRALRLVRTTLRDEDFDALRRKLDEVHGKHPRRPPTTPGPGSGHQ